MTKQTRVMSAWCARTIRANATSSPAVACATALARESSIWLGIDVMPHRCSGTGQVIYRPCRCRTPGRREGHMEFHEVVMKRRAVRRFEEGGSSAR